MPRQLIVLENPKAWNLDLPGADVVAARAYLTESIYAGAPRTNVFNLCRTYGYQTVGYYVSLLAAARGHRPLPSVTTIQDLRSNAVLRIVEDELARDIQRALAQIKGDRFTLSIYFGRNMAKRYDRLCKALFAHFPAPFLRAELVRADTWRLDSLRPVAAGDIPDSHHDFVVARARKYFSRPRVGKPVTFRYDLAMLVDPTAVDSPSNERALARFSRAAEAEGMRVSVIDRDDYGRIAEYDALFIRETTSVDHHTYRFARRAEAEGLVVIDDPTSIIRCTNKVYLAELFDRNDIPAPRTLVVHRDNTKEVGPLLGFPCVLKRPDSSFSAGVVKVSDEAELSATLAQFFADSELVVAQAFMPSSFDWRVGVLDGRALFVCKYFMVPGHWQIQQALGKVRRRYGRVESLALEAAPSKAIALAERAARLIGDGLYGVDLKEVDGRFVVMEINDNPNLDAGGEDAILGDELYARLARWFVARLDARGRTEARS